MLRTKVIKIKNDYGIGNTEIIVSIKTLYLFSFLSRLTVKFSDEYSETVKGDHQLLNNLYDKFENAEAELFFKRYKEDQDENRLSHYYIIK